MAEVVESVLVAGNPSGCEGDRECGAEMRDCGEDIVVGVARSDLPFVAETVVEGRLAIATDNECARGDITMETDL